MHYFKRSTNTLLPHQQRVAVDKTAQQSKPSVLVVIRDLSANLVELVLINMTMGLVFAYHARTNLSIRSTTM